jgi:hypothetical protein
LGEAVYHATGYRCKDFPLTPEKILEGMKRSAKGKKKRTEGRRRSAVGKKT